MQRMRASSYMNRATLTESNNGHLYTEVNKKKLNFVRFIFI